MLDAVRDGDEYRESRPGEEPHGTLQAGPGPVGGFVRFVLHPERIERGCSAAPEVVRAFRFADLRSERISPSSMLPATCGGNGRWRGPATCPATPQPVSSANGRSAAVGRLPSHT